MSINNIHILFLWILTLCLSLVNITRGIAAETDIPDYMLTREHIYEYTFSDTTQAARIIELMRERKLAPKYELDIAQGDLLFNNGRYNPALFYYKTALQSDSVQCDDEKQMEQLHRMISCYDGLHDEKMKTIYTHWRN